MPDGELIDFSVTKQKIIKTDEILRLYANQRDQLKKATSNYHEAKKSLEQSTLEMNRLTMDNERLTYTVENLKIKSNSLEKECTGYREQVEFLEDKINQMVIQHQGNCSELQMEIDMYKDLNSPKKTHNKNEENHKKLEEKCAELEKQLEELAQIKVDKDKEIAVLRISNLKLICENKDVAKLRLQNDNLSKEVDLLEKENEEKTVKLQHRVDKSILIRHKSLLAEKTDKIEEIRQHNQNLQEEVELLQTKYYKLKTNITKCSRTVEVQTDISTSVSKINTKEFQCMNMQSEGENPEDDNADVKRIFEEMKPVSLITEFEDSSSEEQHVENSLPKVNTAAPLKVIKQFRFKKRKHLTRKFLPRKKQDSLLQALLVLKNANINFTISNVPPVWRKKPFFSYNTSKVVKREKISNCDEVTTERLSCLSGCEDSSSCMLLNTTQDKTENLLGFFNIKTEDSTSKSLDNFTDCRLRNRDPAIKELLNRFLNEKLRSKGKVSASLEEIARNMRRNSLKTILPSPPITPVSFSSSKKRNILLFGSDSEIDEKKPVIQKVTNTLEASSKTQTTEIRESVSFSVKDKPTKQDFGLDEGENYGSESPNNSATVNSAVPLACKENPYGKRRRGRPRKTQRPFESNSESPNKCTKEKINHMVTRRMSRCLENSFEISPKLISPKPVSPQRIEVKPTTTVTKEIEKLTEITANLSPKNAFKCASRTKKTKIKIHQNIVIPVGNKKVYNFIDTDCKLNKNQNTILENSNKINRDSMLISHTPEKPRQIQEEPALEPVSPLKFEYSSVISLPSISLDPSKCEKTRPKKTKTDSVTQLNQLDFGIRKRIAHTPKPPEKPREIQHKFQPPLSSESINFSPDIPELEKCQETPPKIIPLQNFKTDSAQLDQLDFRIAVSDKLAHTPKPPLQFPEKFQPASKSLGAIKVESSSLPSDSINFSPASPEPESYEETLPRIIPLQKPCKVPLSKVEMLFSKLLTFSHEEKVLEEIVIHFQSQDVDYISECVFARVRLNIFEKPDTKFTPPAPLLTETQRVFLGFLSRLENIMPGMFDSFLRLVEVNLLGNNVKLTELTAVIRLYTAICKLKKNINKVRQLCCNAFYFMGNLAVPLFFTILTSWIEVIPRNDSVEENLLVKVLVQLVHLKDCNTPGYNLLALRDLLHQYYGYSKERTSSDVLFSELLANYFKNPVRPSDFPLLVFCKNHPTKWVFNKIKECLMPQIPKISCDNFKATVIILLGSICSQFDGAVEYDLNVLNEFNVWLDNIDVTDEVVERSIDLVKNRLDLHQNCKSGF